MRLGVEGHEIAVPKGVFMSPCLCLGDTKVNHKRDRE